MMYINDPGPYHSNTLTTLGWELTVCNMLYPENSPCRAVTKHNASFGDTLYYFLSDHINFQDIHAIMEVGGGYGFLMKDFIKHCNAASVTMVDISPVMLAEQKKNLDGDITCIQSDFLKLDDAMVASNELILCNEAIGDFITLVNVTKSTIAHSDIPALRESNRLIQEYSLAIDDAIFNFNLGALLAMEKMCRTGVKAIYVSEHSCESMAYGEFKDCIDVTPTNNPQQINLYGHSEYTIKFSHLVAIAKRWGYTIYRGVYNTLFQCAMTPQLRFILNSTVNSRDEHEILRQFMGDMFIYEYIVCLR